MTVSVNGAVIGTGSFSGNVSVGGTLTVTGASTLNDNVTIAANKTLTAGGNIAANGHITLADTKYLSSATDVLINAPTGKSVICQVNSVSKTYPCTPNGGMAIGTTVDPGANKILVANTGAYCVTVSGVSSSALYASSNTLGVGSTSFADLQLQASGGGAVSSYVNGVLISWHTGSYTQKFKGSRNAYRVVADANATVALTDRFVYAKTLTAARTYTLPSAVSAGNGWEITVGDEDQTITVTNTLIVATVSSQTISGLAVAPATTYVMNVAGSVVTLVSNGTNWTIKG